MQSTLADTRPLDQSSTPADLQMANLRVQVAPERAGAATLGLLAPEIDLRASVVRHVIPRLHSALRADLAMPASLPHGPARANPIDEVRSFASRMLAGDVDGACQRIRRLRAAGQNLECILLNVLAPTAYHLRDLWSDDSCGLADVTLALRTLQTVLRRQASPFGADGVETGRRALLVAPTPALELDVGLPFFSATLVALFYRRGGWQARIEGGLSAALTATVTGEWFDIVEILMPHGEPLDVVASIIRTVRRISPNPSVGVIVCDPHRTTRPDLAQLVGADAAAHDPVSSLAQAERWRTVAASWSREGSAAKPRRHRLS